MGEIIRAIWELPWYQVLWVAIVDDLILLIKLWPLALGAIIFVVLAALID